MPWLSSSKSWTNQAREPRCNPSRSEMTLTQAAAEMRRINKAKANAESKLVKAEDDGNRGAAAAWRREIKKIEKRAGRLRGRLGWCHGISLRDGREEPEVQVPCPQARERLRFLVW